MKKTKIAFILNIVIVSLTIIASIVMFTGFRFMHGTEIVLEATKLQMFSFFTVDSNIFMGIVALIVAYYEYKLLNKSIKELPRKLYLLKLIATAGVSLTFLVVFTYLGYIAEGGILSLIKNSNLFFHLLIPVLSIITFVFFEKTNKLKFKDTIYGLIPTMIYAIYYLINILIHMENGKVSPKYDWYWFVQNGVWTAIFVVPIIFLLAYGISYLLWKINKER